MANIPKISFSRILFLLTLCITLFPNSALSALNLNPLQDFCVADLSRASPTNNGFPCKSQVSSEDFFYSGLNKPLNTSNPKGVAANSANFMTFPGLYTMGISMYNVALGVGGANPPHSHPGATEAGFVLEGSCLIGFLTTNYTLFSKVVRPGDMFVVPPGLIHYEMNVGKTQTRLLTVVTNDFPSEVVLPHTLFLAKPPIQNAVLMKAFKTDGKTINMLKSKFTN
ncbi:hypothetical protein EUTSA_v10019104mg [Eutrema salsugineum]|uniref:Germin-like protein n=1 Tax=Eutrema salsugineum TaxID=72664 RepID=V4KD08_EUTSA|nr:germin-like protein subfamily T member 3 [Eutrema salsugineum]ESQ27672.1 hypothetical protein EUTSA_v10019104mg [Eutrema salsugineum]